jgi:hypothetical protein
MIGLVKILMIMPYHQNPRKDPINPATRLSHLDNFGNAL